MDVRDAKTIADFLLADFEGEMRTTLRVRAALDRGRAMGGQVPVIHGPGADS